MSGRPKHAVTDAEQLRQLTREAHEAIQGLREAGRELRAEREAIERALTEHCRLLDESITLAAREAVDLVRDFSQKCLDQFKAEVHLMQDYVSRLAGAETPENLADVIVQDAATQLAELLRVDFDGRVVSLVPDQELLSQRRAARLQGGVYVTNDPDLVPADSDLVIDARDPGALRFSRPVAFTGSRETEKGG